MSCDHYNYSISLIRRSSDGWMINSDDVFSTHPFTAELSEKAVGDGYLASKVEGKLSYCIFLSGRVCHSDVYGWIIMMNGWQIFDLATYLQLAQDAWRELEQAQVKEGAITQRLQMIVESKGLVTLLSPIQADQMGWDSNQALSRTSVEKQLEPARNKVKWWKPVALILGVVALLALGIMFSKEIDFYWWRYYANQGDAEAQCNLGACYANGTGVPQDYTEAVRWYRLAADQGLAIGQYNLGYHLYNGLGVKPDRKEALGWLKKASAQEDEDAKLLLRQIGEQ